MTSSTRRRLQRAVAISLITAAAVTASLIATAGAASGTRHMVLTTSVTAIAPNGRATVTATVKFVLLAPKGGQVRFYNATTHRNLGTAPLRAKSGGACAQPVHVCQARLSVPGYKLAKGKNHILGFFNPDRTYYPTFVGRTVLYRGVRPNCRSISPASLPVFTAAPIAYSAAHHSSLCKGRVNFKSIDVIVYSKNRTVVTRNTVVATGSQKLPCSSASAGVLAFSISGSRPPGALAVELFGSTATAAHKAHPNGFVCYESTIRFRTVSGGWAKRTGPNQYYGLLPHCRDNDGDDLYPQHPNGDDPQIHPAPCIEWQQYAVKHGVASWKTWVQPTTGDPLYHTR